MRNLSIPTNKKPPISPDSLQNTDLALIQRSIQLAGNAPKDIEEIPFELTTSEQTGPKGEPLLKVDLKIDTAGIRYTRQEEKRNYKVIAAAFYADQNGKSLNFEWWEINNKLDEEEYSRAGECGIPFSVTIHIKFKNQIVRIVIYDNKVAQEVAFCSYDQLPIALAVLVDRSGSVAPIHPLLQLGVYLKIDPEDVGFGRVNGQYIGAQDITVFYADEKGRVLGHEWRRLEHRLNPEQYNQTLKEGILFKATIPTEAAKRILNVVVYDEISNQIGSKIVKLP
jgi:hypothetical protein